MAQSAILIFERQPRWTPELQRQMTDQDIRIRPCHSPRELSRVLVDYSKAVIILDLAAGAGECLQFLRSTKRNENVTSVVIASSDDQDLEWPARELGVTAFLIDPVSGDDLAGLCRDQLEFRHRALRCQLP